MKTHISPTLVIARMTVFGESYEQAECALREVVEGRMEVQVKNRAEQQVRMLALARNTCGCRQCKDSAHGPTTCVVVALITDLLTHTPAVVSE